MPWVRYAEAGAVAREDSRVVSLVESGAAAVAEGRWVGQAAPVERVERVWLTGGALPMEGRWVGQAAPVGRVERGWLTGGALPAEGRWVAQAAPAERVERVWLTGRAMPAEGRWVAQVAPAERVERIWLSGALPAEGRWVGQAAVPRPVKENCAEVAEEVADTVYHEGLSRPVRYVEWNACGGRPEVCALEEGPSPWVEAGWGPERGAVPFPSVFLQSNAGGVECVPAGRLARGSGPAPWIAQARGRGLVETELFAAIGGRVSLPVQPDLEAMFDAARRFYRHEVGYNASGDVAGIEVYGEGGAWLYSRSLEYDGAGNLTGVVTLDRQNAGVALRKTIAYDGAGDVSRVVREYSFGGWYVVVEAPVLEG